MEVFALGDTHIVNRAADILRSGGVILYPTDTLYGLGADALSDTAVKKVRQIKGRDEGKPIHAIVADLAMAVEYAEVNDVARKLATKFLPGPLTLILKKKAGIKTGIAKGINTFGIRIPDNRFCLDLAQEFRKPFTTTSANLAGTKPERSVEKILTQLGERAELIDLVIDAGDPPAGGGERLPSTVVDVSEGELKILREGTIVQGVLVRAF
ncbi:threonylcarbamoyl-AMP synthase [Candidatus Kaiserbacteria bacterium RIFCSPLOWO2_01_FULL_53_17]|uniref:L-threonylcarbamoyladenylate synthase n=1 Tax=Candidatus Kaiserbacteria bacterium RIFCSPLOWO2_01_FULL_53_17 TaxID=1798511 RepID=A0A1F6EHL0_9BACT|nr:MAG: threonylcarbamoyl-AMP synthase [Candidatus Kaiserbacteria bacterium RIFCSPLOWO2_01_FULL_53_17]